MIDEHRRVFRVSLVIVLVVAAAFCRHDRTVALGLLLGISLYFVYLLVLTKTATAQLGAAPGSTMPHHLGFVLRLAVLALPLFIAARHQQHFSIVAAFVPLFVNHIVTYLLYARGGQSA